MKKTRKKAAKKAVKKAVRKSAKKMANVHTDKNSHNTRITVISGLKKSLGALRRNYLAMYWQGKEIVHLAEFSAMSLKEAKNAAMFAKRHEPELKKYSRLKVSVKLLKK